jgi:membrane-associated phospholipid phosphatase
MTSSAAPPDTASIPCTQPLASEQTHVGERLRALIARCSPQDWVVFTYLLVLNALLLLRIGEPGYLRSALEMGSLLGFFLFVVLPVRGNLVRDGFVAPLAYRVAIHGTVQTSYFFFVAYLPLINPGNLDRQLYALDLQLFGFEPSVVLERFISPFTSEWFAFFYFCYFFVLALHSIPIVLFERRERLLGEFTLGMLLVFCVGHLGYLCVPGFGPVRELEDYWTKQFPSGLWVNTVLETVKSGGAQKDIFPSLHTAAPTFISLFSFRNRKHLPFSRTWPVVAFFTVNIIVATMFLRWHWLIDVVVGILLALLAHGLAIRITAWDLERRSARGLGPSWPRFHIGLRRTS